MSYINKKTSEKLWACREEIGTDSGEGAAIARELGFSEAFGKLLSLRGYKTAEAASSFLRVEDGVLHDPFLLTDMDKAVKVMEGALSDDLPIMIYGDYDVDGVTSVSILQLYLESRGATVSHYIPDRLGEGYGMSGAAIEKMAADGVGLIITVDTGITAVDEIAAAKAAGMRVIITDHHECRAALPEADAVVNPRRPDCDYPFKSLAGVGVVFKLICAAEMSRSTDKQGALMRVCNEYADLVALGTVADVMPLVDENRLIVKYGLSRMQKGGRMAISALIAASMRRPDGKSSRAPRISSTFIGFTLAPRINAAGRITNASIAAELFLTDSRARADELADELCETNRFRQSEENKIATEAYARIESEHDFERDPVIVLDDDGWHHGVIGIVASRITEKYGLPSILVSYEGRDAAEPQSPLDMGKGSGRSVKGLNLVDALVHCGDLLEKYGGHELAAGLSLKRGNIDAFREKINEYARTVLPDGMPVQCTLDYDMELGADDITLGLAEDLRLLEPCGIGNPVPCFVLRDVPVCDVIPVSAGKHSKLVLNCGGREISAMYFSHSPANVPVFGGERADLLFTVDVNEYCGVKSVQLVCKDVRSSEADAKRRAEEIARFEALKNGTAEYAEDCEVPDRADISAVYTLLRRECRIGNGEMSVRAILGLLSDGGNTSVNYIKLRFSLLILRELNLLGIEEQGEDYFNFNVYSAPAKTDLERSGILRKLRGMRKRRA